MTPELIISLVCNAGLAVGLCVFFVWHNQADRQREKQRTEELTTDLKTFYETSLKDYKEESLRRETLIRDEYAHREKALTETIGRMADFQRETLVKLILDSQIFQQNNTEVVKELKTAIQSMMGEK